MTPRPLFITDEKSLVSNVEADFIVRSMNYEIKSTYEPSIMQLTRRDKYYIKENNGEPPDMLIYKFISKCWYIIFLIGQIFYSIRWRLTSSRMNFEYNVRYLSAWTFGEQLSPTREKSFSLSSLNRNVRVLFVFPYTGGTMFLYFIHEFFFFFFFFFSCN